MAAVSAMSAGVIGGLVLAAVWILLSGGLLRLLGVPESVLPMALLYLRIICCGFPVLFLYNFEAAVFRSIGDTRLPLIVLVFSGCMNVALNLFFVIGLGRSVDGVAIATVLSQLFSVIVLMVVLRKRGLLVFPWEERCFDPVILKNILRIGIPAGLQGMMFSLANICIQSAINSLGAEVMAGSAAANNIEVFSYYVLMSYGQACTTFVGQNYGAGKQERCKMALKTSLLQGFAATALMVGVLYTLRYPVARIFNTDPVIVEAAVYRLQVILLSHFFSLAVEIFSGYMRGFGESMKPTMVSLVCICGLRIVWILTAFRMEPTYHRLLLVYPVSLASAAAGMFGLFLLLRKKLVIRNE